MLSDSRFLSWRNRPTEVEGQTVVYPDADVVRDPVSVPMGLEIQGVGHLEGREPMPAGVRNSEPFENLPHKFQGIDADIVALVERELHPILVRSLHVRADVHKWSASGVLHSHLVDHPVC